MTDSIRIFSYGGGVQSNAALVLQAQGVLDYDAFVFANVGDDSENPATLEYIRDYARPFAAEHNIEFVEVQKTTYKTPETLWDYIHRTKRSVPIPARMSNGAPGNRSCTIGFKITVVDKWIKKGGYTHATVGLGISIDEYTRVRHTNWYHSEFGRNLGFMKRRSYPFIERRINRLECHKIIADADLPQPPKSSCFFCPFKRRNEWIEMKRKQPDLFDRSVQLEKHINEKREAMDRDYVYLHPDCVPLVDAVGNQLTLFDDDTMDMCETGYCHT